MAARQTPVMRQHAEAKGQYPDAIVFFRLGDFYEMFGQDAVDCAELLDLTLTSRNRGKPDEIPMAGVPHHAAHGYIGRLLTAGRKVAICEQMADPSTVKGIVPRQVVRVLTPGTVTHHDHLRPDQNNWLGAVHVADPIGLALYDVSTGELLAGCVDNLANAQGELARSGPREILIGSADPATDLTPIESIVASALPTAVSTSDGEIDAKQLPDDLRSVVDGASDLSESARAAAARVLRFARSCNPTACVAPTRVAPWQPSETLYLDPTAEAHLELTEAQSGDKRLTLLATIDFTQTTLGKRRLRRDLLSPLKDPERINARLDEVELFVRNPALREGLRGHLKRVTDIERLSRRVELGEATPRDLGRLRDGLLASEAAVAQLESLHDDLQRKILGLEYPVDTVGELARLLERALVESPPAVAKEGRIFREGFDETLTRLHALYTDGAQLTVDLERRLRAELDIPTLKVRYTRVFGWYIEVSRTHLARVPESFQRKQTIAGGERYCYSELDEIAENLRGAEDNYRSHELEHVRQLNEKVREHSSRLAALASRLARWDVASSLAELAQSYDYVRPTVDGGEILSISDGRHPVVERWAAAGRFVPNDIHLDIDAHRLWLITGPNMAGKSTVLRQTALIVLLAQMGSFVPAKQAQVGVVDRVLSRVGASDNLARGESTFMVEMRETAEILRSATRRSLIILDEVGRGTSTFDGLAIASAVAEHLAESVQCRVLFATHYHEMTSLSDTSEHVANYSVTAEEKDGNVVFLHRLVAGPASQSYGIAVARLAGLPAQVLQRAETLLGDLESSPAQAKGRKGRKARKLTPNASRGRRQLELFQDSDATDKRPSGSVLDALKNVDLARLQPNDALQLIAEAQVHLSAQAASPKARP